MRYCFFGLLLMLAFSCCHNDLKKDEEYKTNENLPQLRAEWTMEYEVWKALDIQNYQFTYIYDYGGEYVLRITVKNSRFHDAVDIETAEDVSAWWHFTIDDTFTSIANQFDRDENKSEVSEGLISTTIRIRYDQEYHFPASYFVGHNFKKGSHVGGNAVETIIKDFKIIDE